MTDRPEDAATAQDVIALVIDGVNGYEEPLDVAERLLAALSEQGYSVVKFGCANCGQTLTAAGALLFAPPDDDGRTEKLHVCRECWPLFRGLVREV